MIEFLKKLADEKIKVSIDTDIHGMIKIKLTHRDNNSYYIGDLKEVTQLDCTFVELLYHTYDELKEFEARENDL